MQKNILVDYQLELSEETKKNILEYFDKITEDKIINKKVFTTALRRLISRSLAGSRQEIDIKSDSALKLYIDREDLWSKEIMDNGSFYGEIDQICKDDILIGNSWKLYNLLDGDSILNEIIKIKDNTSNENQNQNNINSEANQNVGGNADNNQNNDNIGTVAQNDDNDNDNDDDDAVEEEEEERDDL